MNDISKLSNNKIIKKIEEKLKTIYDPEFPIIDIFTLGLIYKISLDEKKKQIDLLITFTTPACPMAEMLQEMIKNGINEILPKYLVNITITFDPMRTQEMIKDPDLKRMFE